MEGEYVDRSRVKKSRPNNTAQPTMPMPVRLRHAALSAALSPRGRLNVADVE